MKTKYIWFWGSKRTYGRYLSKKIHTNLLMSTGLVQFCLCISCCQQMSFLPICYFVLSKTHDSHFQKANSLFVFLFIVSYCEFIILLKFIFISRSFFQGFWVLFCFPCHLNIQTRTILHLIYLVYQSKVF